MADYAALIRNTLASVASPAFESLKTQNINWKKYASEDGEGFETFDPSAGTSVKALVDMKRKRLRLDDGTFVNIVATLTFVDPLTGATPHDIFTLPDGTTGPTFITGGFLDPATNEPFVTEVSLGGG